ncbi:MAG TPA: hypothetical protein VNX68_14160 [Nitrosopumilaceae archaeon]|nr:hypothetical protein [Nitrosopumilaceae archaeon]
MVEAMADKTHIRLCRFGGAAGKKDIMSVEIKKAALMAAFLIRNEMVIT